MPLTQQKTILSKTKRLSIELWLPRAFMIVSVGLTLFAIFIMSSWAEIAPWHHALQHVLIFLAGSSFGGSFIYLLGNGVDHES